MCGMLNSRVGCVCFMFLMKVFRFLVKNIVVFLQSDFILMNICFVMWYSGRQESIWLFLWVLNSFMLWLVVKVKLLKLCIIFLGMLVVLEVQIRVVSCLVVVGVLFLSGVQVCRLFYWWLKCFFGCNGMVMVGMFLGILGVIVGQLLSLLMKIIVDLECFSIWCVDLVVRLGQRGMEMCLVIQIVRLVMIQCVQFFEMIVIWLLVGRFRLCNQVVVCCVWLFILFQFSFLIWLLLMGCIR